MERIEGCGAVVIGGGSGVGRGTALGLGAVGAQVVVADIEADAAQAVADEIRAAGGRAVAARVDGTSRDSLGELADRAERELGSLHILSNNVGVHVDRPLPEATEAEWAWVIEFNLMSIVRAVDVFLPRLRRHGEPGHIVNTASMAALLASGPEKVFSHLGMYTSTKHAILGYTEILRHELAPEGIGVSVLCPGMVLSNLGSTSARNRPARHGGPFDEPGPVPDAVVAMSMKPEDVGPIVVRGIRGNRLHILTHPKRSDQIIERHEVLMSDFEFFASAPKGGG